VLAVLLASGPSSAQPLPLPPDAATSAVPDQPPGLSPLLVAKRSKPRVRLGLGGAGGGGYFWASGRPFVHSLARRDVTGGGAGFAFDIGLQINDRFAVYVHGAVDTILFANSLLGAVLGEVGYDTVSLATGVGVMGILNTPILSRGESRTLLALPVVLGITPFGRSESSMRRSGFHIWLEGAVRIELGRSSVGPYFGLKLGYVWR
jgi:hypothetical protein